ncbi:homocysteine S-methyltransferase family protein [Marinobacter sp. OP 3.4]|uniref:homocysteine S-methyltransferase family protein n=1 Tax=Marinobacter sp. OP 3.4 TaxID=3076501 RepID=UPI002E1AEB41
MTAKYRHNLPQLGDRIFLLDGGLETTLIFQEGVDLPLFAAFDLLSSAEGEQRLEDYFRPYIDIARQSRRGLILETPTWRASKVWADQLGYSAEELAEANRRAVALAERIRERHETADTPMVISGCIGPKGDGYDPSEAPSIDEARAYHQAQVDTFSDSAADLVAALTMNTVDEAIGIAQAAQSAGIPLVISFTTETDGRLPSGVTLAEAIRTVDEVTGGAPAYYMINCAHPEHFQQALDPGEDWTRRIRGLRANASRKSHEELDGSTELDEGNPAELGQLYASLRERFGHLTLLGGCCGTDDRHIRAIDACCRH